MQGYIDLLISKLKDVAVSGQPTNMVQMVRLEIIRRRTQCANVYRYNFTTFDIIGDLSFGTPFNCLVSNEYHYWVLNTIKVIQSAPYIQFLAQYPLLGKLVKLFHAKIYQSRSETIMFKYTRTAVDRRLNDKSQDGRYDFIDALTKDNIVHGEEIYGNAVTLVLAGSETTATLLSGATYYVKPSSKPVPIQPDRCWLFLKSCLALGQNTAFSNTDLGTNSESAPRQSFYSSKGRF